MLCYRHRHQKPKPRQQQKKHRRIVFSYCFWPLNSQPWTAREPSNQAHSTREEHPGARASTTTTTRPRARTRRYSWAFYNRKCVCACACYGWRCECVWMRVFELEEEEEVKILSHPRRRRRKIVKNQKIVCAPFFDVKVFSDFCCCWNSVISSVKWSSVSQMKILTQSEWIWSVRIATLFSSQTSPLFEIIKSTLSISNISRTVLLDTSGFQLCKQDGKSSRIKFFSKYPANFHNKSHRHSTGELRRESTFNTQFRTVRFSFFPVCLWIFVSSNLVALFWENSIRRFIIQTTEIAIFSILKATLLKVKPQPKHETFKWETRFDVLKFVQSSRVEIWEFSIQFHFTAIWNLTENSFKLSNFEVWVHFLVAKKVNWIRAKWNVSIFPSLVESNYQKILLASLCYQIIEIEMTGMDSASHSLFPDASVDRKHEEIVACSNGSYPKKIDIFWTTFLTAFPIREHWFQKKHVLWKLQKSVVFNFKVLVSLNVETWKTAISWFISLSLFYKAKTNKVLCFFTQ